MKMSQETDRAPQPYTPTPDGFERGLRAWVRLPMNGGITHDASGEASVPSNEHGVLRSGT